MMTTQRFGARYYSPAQLQVARRTVVTVRSLGLWTIPSVAAVCTQMVESSLAGPIWHGDTPTSTSRGAYQQEDPWVPASVRGLDVDPRRSIFGSTMLFLYGGYSDGTPGLLSMNWVSQPIGITCQQVQKSNTPTAYTDVAPDAQAMVVYLLAESLTRSLIAGLT